MKTLILTSMALLLLTACKDAPRKDPDPKDLTEAQKPAPVIAPSVTITLSVNAAELYETSNPAQEDIMKHCELYDSNKPEKISGGKLLREFETEVKRKDLVEWEGVNDPSNSDYKVEIESIVYALDKEITLDNSKKENFFNAIALCSNNGKTVRGEVAENIPTMAGKDLYHIYWLNFRISKDGITKVYSIDPRLKIK